MAKKTGPSGKDCNDSLPKVILLESEDQSIDRTKINEEIQYFITQIILLADKIGRPSRNQCLEVNDAA